MNPVQEFSASPGMIVTGENILELQEYSIFKRFFAVSDFAHAL